MSRPVHSINVRAESDVEDGEISNPDCSISLTVDSIVDRPGSLSIVREAKETITVAFGEGITTGESEIANSTAHRNWSKTQRSIAIN